MFTHQIPMIIANMWLADSDNQDFMTFMISLFVLPVLIVWMPCAVWYLVKLCCLISCQIVSPGGLFYWIDLIMDSLLTGGAASKVSSLFKIEIKIKILKMTNDQWWDMIWEVWGKVSCQLHNILLLISLSSMWHVKNKKRSQHSLQCGWGLIVAMKGYQ